MELDRPHHRTTSNNNELFICFTSRLSSSSMKISKSILSPGRSRDQSMPMSLPTSLSRRLRTNGSIKGGAGQASPMFPNTTNKKRGCGYENPEPSSPKVTCIGQVRVKTKKKAAAAKKQTRSLSRRRSSNGGGGGGGGDRGEVSFRRIDDGFSLKCEDKVRFSQQINQEGRNQRWVHLPLTICEALKAFGNEFSCLFPCSSSCFSNSDREKVEKENNGGSCGAVFARWLVTLQDGENGKQREIELVVGEEEDEEDHEVDDTMLMSRSTRRRHVLEDFEVKGESFNGDKNIEQVEEKVEGRVSVCVPPKNALLLMRCRSDPVKMAALTNRSCESPPVLIEDEDLDAIKVIDEEIIEEIQQLNEEDEAVQEEIELVQATELLELAGEEEEEGQKGNLIEEESSSSLSSDREEMEAIEIILLAIESALQEEINADIELNNKDEEETEELDLNDEETEKPIEEEEERKLSMEESSVLPDCLLLMMCEPKLSMEVSKETWVCSTDFVRCLPQKKKTKKEVKKEINLETNTKRVSFDLPLPPRPPPQLVVPPRSSCTLPISMASMIEQKLVNAVGYEPFVLTRCKSEPMRTAKAKLAAPESCYWTKRKLEPLRRAAYQVGATGVGF